MSEPTTADRLAEQAKLLLTPAFEGGPLTFPTAENGMRGMAIYVSSFGKTGRLQQLAAALRAYEAEKEMREAEHAAIKALTDWILVTHNDEGAAMAHLPPSVYWAIRDLIAAFPDAKASSLATDDPEAHQQAKTDHAAEQESE